MRHTATGFPGNGQVVAMDGQGPALPFRIACNPRQESDPVGRCHRIGMLPIGDVRRHLHPTTDVFKITATATRIRRLITMHQCVEHGRLTPVPFIFIRRHEHFPRVPIHRIHPGLQVLAMLIHDRAPQFHAIHVQQKILWDDGTSVIGQPGA